MIIYKKENTERMVIVGKSPKWSKYPEKGSEYHVSHYRYQTLFNMGFMPIGCPTLFTSKERAVRYAIDYVANVTKTALEQVK